MGADPEAAFGAVLLGMTLRPLAQALGFYGEAVVDACAASVARSMPIVPRADS